MNLLDALTPEETLFAVEEGWGLDSGLFLDPDRFYREELGRRAAVGFPPYGRLLLLESARKTVEGLKSPFEALREKALGLGLTAGLSACTGRGRPGRRLMVKGDEVAVAAFLEGIADNQALRIEVDPLNI
jgi:primosomal protein N'